MDTKTEVRDFLTSRRAKITPEQAGLTTYGTRQVPGLRREEVATLAGVSVDYYNRMERGNLAGVSDGVLEAVAGARPRDGAGRSTWPAPQGTGPPAGAAARPRGRCARPSSG